MVYSPPAAQVAGCLKARQKAITPALAACAALSFFPRESRPFLGEKIPPLPAASLTHTASCGTPGVSARSWPKPNTRVTSRKLARRALSVNSSRLLAWSQIAVDGARTDLQSVHNLRHGKATLMQ